MQIKIHAQGFTLTSSLREHVTRRLTFALSRFDDRITRISVRLADVNGPRGGRDKHCRLRIRLPRWPELIVEDIDTDMYAAVSRSAARAGRHVARKLARK
jgi:ribosomal subunit interface protein